MIFSSKFWIFSNPSYIFRLNVFKIDAKYIFDENCEIFLINYNHENDDFLSGPR